MKPLMVEPRQTLRACVSTVLNDYFAQVDPEMINDLYAMVLSEVEAPLLEAVMQKARSNQSRAAQMLGVNRGTLRKKLRQYDMLE
ncbi:MAG: DNA-binding transcriptional regulator Fis [Pseudomonadota bacterium]|jgi:Fis family transcriptional regulator